MLYAMLVYHPAGVVEAFTPEQDAALMKDLLAAHDKLIAAGKAGPAARLSGTAKALTVRGQGEGMVTDGPFAETKEQLLGFYIFDCADADEVVAIAQGLKRVNESAVYEIRPVQLYIPGASLPEN